MNKLHTWMKLIDTYLAVKRYCTSMIAKGKIKNHPAIPEEFNVVRGKDKLFSHSKQEGGWKTEKNYGPPFLKEQVGGGETKKLLPIKNKRKCGRGERKKINTYGDTAGQYLFIFIFSRFVFPENSNFSGCLSSECLPHLNLSCVICRLPHSILPLPLLWAAFSFTCTTSCSSSVSCHK